MSRRSNSGQSSLELLLDTICNTFGGVLFLAILVSVLLRMSSQALQQDESSESEEATAEEVELAVAAQLEELRVVQAALQVQGTLREQFIEPESSGTYADLQAARELRSLLQRKKLEQQKVSAQQQLETAAREQQTEAMAEKVQAANRRREVADGLLRAEIASRTKAVRLPRVRQSFKREVGLLMQFGRAYVWHRYDPAGERLGINTADVVVVSNSASIMHVTPKPYAGVELGAADSRDKLIRMLRPFRPGMHFLTCVVWEDSFEAFEEFKSVAVELGFEYRIMPHQEGNPVVDQGGNNSSVQ